MKVRLVFLGRHNAEKSYEQEMVEDMLSICHVYSCRHYGRRGADSTRSIVTPEADKRAVELYTEGKSYAAITHVLRHEGFTCPRHKRPYGRQVITNHLKQKLKFVAALGQDGTPQDVVEEFVKDRCVVSVGAKVRSSDLYGMFRKFCAERNLELASQQMLAKRLKRMGFQSTRWGHGYSGWKGLALAEETPCTGSDASG